MVIGLIHKTKGKLLFYFLIICALVILSCCSPIGYAKYGISNPTQMNTLSVPLLIKALKDEDRFIRSSAAQGLSYLAIFNARENGNFLSDLRKKAVPALCQALNDKDNSVKKTVILSLYTMILSLDTIGVESNECISTLIKCLGDNNAYIREQSAKIISEIGSEAKAAVPALIELLDDSEKKVRFRAAYALGRK